MIFELVRLSDVLSCRYSYFLDLCVSLLSYSGLR